MTTEAKTSPAKTGQEVAKAASATVSERFTTAVIREFESVAGQGLQLNPYQKKLAQDLFIKIDTTLKELEGKRTDQNKPAVTWQNVNMGKLAIDAVHRINLGLDALVPGHIYPIPYLNGRTKKYDLDLRIGYKGKDLYRRQMAEEPPVDVIYELVYSNDKFTVFKKGIKNPVESYQFDVPEPFNRGEIVGGFAYIIYKDETKNKLITVQGKDFDKAKAKAQSKDFWEAWPEAMKLKTIVNRATDKIPIDPKKVNASFLAAEHDEEIADRAIVDAQIAENANTGPALELEAESSGEAPPEPEEARTEGKKPASTLWCPSGGHHVYTAACEDCTEREGCPSHEAEKNGKQGRVPGF